mmetsp:Transcript_33440/g.85742  ORF Transcript_33440/g.85742 Transcript_33440/m.85742 type:complete len:206 (+) Transcript_33440:379-996(+)
MSVGLCGRTTPWRATAKRTRTKLRTGVRTSKTRCWGGIPPSPGCWGEPRMSLGGTRGSTRWERRSYRSGLSPGRMTRRGWTGRRWPWCSARPTVRGDPTQCVPRRHRGPVRAPPPGRAPCGSSPTRSRRSRAGRQGVPCVHRADGGGAGMHDAPMQPRLPLRVHPQVVLPQSPLPLLSGARHQAVAAGRVSGGVGGRHQECQGSK